MNMEAKKPVFGMTESELTRIVNAGVPTLYRVWVLEWITNCMRTMQPMVNDGLSERVVENLLHSILNDVQRQRRLIKPPRKNPKKRKEKKKPSPSVPSLQQRWYRNEYLNSTHWKSTRIRIIDLRGGKCEKCGLDRTLVVHHLTYERIGCEEDGDLQVLCRWCHDKIHEGEKKAKRRKIR